MRVSVCQKYYSSSGLKFLTFKKMQCWYYIEFCYSNSIEFCLQYHNHRIPWQKHQSWTLSVDNEWITVFFLAQSKDECGRLEHWTNGALSERSLQLVSFLRGNACVSEGQQIVHSSYLIHRFTHWSEKVLLKTQTTSNIIIDLKFFSTTYLINVLSQNSSSLGNILIVSVLY